MPTYHSFPTAVLENDQLRLEYLTAGAVRIVSLSYRGSPNLFVDVPDIFWDTPIGKYYPYGGHRLWISPEIPAQTYIPDDPELSLTSLPQGVECSAPTEIGSGVSKGLRIELDRTQPVVHLVHTITNQNPTPLTIAPWTISMFRQGGTAILPQPVGNVDPHGLLPNRLMVLWPYTQINEARLVLRDDCMLVHATPALPPLKLGYRNTAGWLAYWHENVLFRKTFDYQSEASYPDGGCNAELYCGDRFVELESLAPLISLAPGQSVQHTETWELFPGLDVPFLPQGLLPLIS